MKPNKNTEKEKVLKEYEARGNEIIKKMYQVLMRMHRKADDIKYRKIIESLDNEVK